MGVVWGMCGKLQAVAVDYRVGDFQSAAFNERALRNAVTSGLVSMRSSVTAMIDNSKVVVWISGVTATTGLSDASVL